MCGKSRSPGDTRRQQPPTPEVVGRIAGPDTIEIPRGRDAPLRRSAACLRTRESPTFRMARKILLLGDDDDALRQAAAALASLGSEIATERSAEAALERLLGAGADLAVIDAGLSGGAGLRAASDLQRRLGAFPLVLLVARERQDLVNEAHAISALPVGKPIRAEELREAVLRALGPEPVALTPGPAAVQALPPVSGELRERPLHVVLGDLLRRSASGRLDIASGSYRARVHLVYGWVASATCNDARALAGYADVAAGRLPRARLEAALAHVRESRVPLPSALRATGAFDEAGLAQALARQAAAVVEQACGLASGSWSFQAGAEPTLGPAARLHPLALAHAGVLRAYPAPTIRSWLDRHGPERLVAHPELAATLAAAGIATDLGARIAAGATGDALLATLPEAELALVFTLAGFNLLRFAPSPGLAGHATPPPVVRPVSPAAGTPIAHTDRRAIEAEDRRTADATHYDVLGVTRDADPAAVKRAYFAAAKRWHSDAFAGRDLGDLAPVVERIFARISEASTVLGDPAKRAEYDVFLERKAKGLPTDVASVLKAEETFVRARALFRAQRYADAEALFRQAVEINPAEAEFWAYLGASCHRARGSAAVAEAREAFARARALIPRSLVTEYLEAQLEIGEGELDAAERRLRNILLDKPDHPEAARDLRTLRERKERETATGRGFLGTLWKRK